MLLQRAASRASQNCFACTASGDCGASAASFSFASSNRPRAHSAWALPARCSSLSNPLGNLRRYSSSVLRASAGRPARRSRVARDRSATSAANRSCGWCAEPEGGAGGSVVGGATAGLGASSAVGAATGSLASGVAATCATWVTWATCGLPSSVPERNAKNRAPPTMPMLTTTAEISGQIDCPAAAAVATEPTSGGSAESPR